MPEDTWVGRKLCGYCNLLTVDRQSVSVSIMHFIQLAVNFPKLTIVEVNPLRILAEGEGLVAVDVRGSMLLD